MVTSSLISSNDSVDLLLAKLTASVSAPLQHSARADTTEIDLAHLERLHHAKTGALLRFAVRAGARLGGASAGVLGRLDTYGHALGLAFQIVDDVLDVQGTSHELGKTAGKDEAAGKPTYPALYGLERSKELARAAVTRAERALVDAGLPDDRLMAIAHWVVERRC